MKIGIIGYGRIGRELVRLCLFLGADVTVYTKRGEVCRDLLSLGIRAQVITSECDLSENDLVFNTAPEAIIRSELIAALPEKTSIIDLASGNIFEPSARTEPDMTTEPQSQWQYSPTTPLWRTTAPEEIMLP